MSDVLDEIANIGDVQKQSNLNERIDHNRRVQKRSKRIRLTSRYALLVCGPGAIVLIFLGVYFDLIEVSSFGIFLLFPAFLASMILFFMGGLAPVSSRRTSYWLILMKRRWVRVSLLVAAVLSVAALVDRQRVHNRMDVLVKAARLGSLEIEIASSLGEPDSKGKWWGSYGEGTTFEYHVPYLWEHICAVMHVPFSFRKRGRFWVSSTRANWYTKYSPTVLLDFADGHLIEVGTRPFSSGQTRVRKHASDARPVR